MISKTSIWSKTGTKLLLGLSNIGGRQSVSLFTLDSYDGWDKFLMSLSTLAKYGSYPRFWGGNISSSEKHFRF